MFDTYRELFSKPGSVRITIGGFLARLPMSMDSLAIIFIVLSADQKYALAGTLTAVAAFVSVISTPFWSHIADKHGQDVVLRTAIPLRIISMIVFILLVTNDAPIATWFVAIIFAESGSMSIGSLTRRRRAYQIEEGNAHVLNAAYSFESMLDETVFIVGPIISTILATSVAPSAGLVAGVIFLAIGGFIVLSHSASLPPTLERTKQDSLLKSRVIHSVALPIGLLGGVFSANNLAVVAFSQEHGNKAMAGLLLGLSAFGGAIATGLNGVVKWNKSHAWRFKFFLIGIAVASSTFPFIHHPFLIFLALFVQSICVGPLFPNAIPLVEAKIPASHMTQAMSLIVVGIPLSGALGAALTGTMIDQYGAFGGFCVLASFAIAAVIAMLPYAKSYE